jgi:hypothetical protein
MRTVRMLKIPSEKALIKLKNAFAASLGTATAYFDAGGMRGAYVTDPCTYVETVAAASPFLVVGGVHGGNHCKLGVTYVNKEGELEYSALMVFDGKDSWDSLIRLCTPDLTPFTSRSSPFLHIFGLLQFLFFTRPTFLNGDWLFLNAVLGIGGIASHYPCPICQVHKDSLLSPAPLRPPFNPSLLSQHSVNHTPLLLVPSLMIVPLPLHTALGISNRLVDKVFPPLVGEEAVAAAKLKVKSTHSAGCGGKQAVHELNGIELASWTSIDKSSHLLGEPFCL